MEVNTINSVTSNMPKHTISIGLVLIMAIAMAAPILHIDCDMPCCEVEKMTCCNEVKTVDETKECSMRKDQCEHSQFVPIISGPKSDKKSSKVDMDKPICTMKTDAPKCQLSEKTAFQSQPSDSQAKFSVPLRL